MRKRTRKRKKRKEKKKEKRRKEEKDEMKGNEQKENKERKKKEEEKNKLRGRGGRRKRTRRKRKGKKACVCYFRSHGPSQPEITKVEFKLSWILLNAECNRINSFRLCHFAFAIHDKDALAHSLGFVAQNYGITSPKTLDLSQTLISLNPCDKDPPFLFYC